MSAEEHRGAAAGIPGSSLPGPYEVGDYAQALRDRLRGFARVQIVGELVNLRVARARVYFELRDAQGAVACSAWRNEWERALAYTGPLSDGMQIVVAGGCDYYVGSSTSSPGFSFNVTDVRVAGEGDLLARIERLRRTLAAEGLLDPQKRLPRPLLPRTIGVVTAETGKARDDIQAGLARRGWRGRLVWAFAAVQDRHAAPTITRALGDLAVIGGVEVVIVARGGGSLADLLCFCDETLCRSVALLPVPVIASVGHHTDHTVLDDVAAVSCSTPTHAAEAAVPVDCRAAWAQLAVAARRLREHGRRAILVRARTLAHLSRAPGQQIVRHRHRLHQLLRELRATARRRTERGRSQAGVHALVLGRTAARAAGSDRTRRSSELERLSLALGAHDPARTMARGYALVQSADGVPLGSAAAARRARDLSLHFYDGSVPARVSDEEER